MRVRPLWAEPLELRFHCSAGLLGDFSVLIAAEGETFWNVKRCPRRLGNGSRRSRHLVKNKEHFSEYVCIQAILILKKHAIRLNVEASMNQ